MLDWRGRQPITDVGSINVLNFYYFIKLTANEIKKTMSKVWRPRQPSSSPTFFTAQLLAEISGPPPTNQLSFHHPIHHSTILISQLSAGRINIFTSASSDVYNYFSALQIGSKGL
jgi:hypothetical protein